MRHYLGRGVLGTLLVTTTLLVTAGCAVLPPGVDGDLGNQWPAMAEPAGWSPQAGKCSKDFAGQTSRAAYEPIDCDSEHYFETVAVAEFTGNGAALPRPPQPGSPELSAAWSDCDAKTKELLGDDWRNGRLWIGVSTPSSSAWEGGVRWYTCHVEALKGYNGEALQITRSLKGEFTKDSPLRVGCLAEDKSNSMEDKDVPCTSAHDREFAGTFVSPLTYEQMQDYAHTGDQMHAKCRSVIAKFAGVPDDGNMKYRVGTIVQYPTKANWEAGDHSVRCYLWFDKTLTRSFKGAGVGALPIRRG